MNKRPLAYITRVEKFSAAHRLHSNSLSDEENIAVFGKCNNLHGHGHNYTVSVTLKGPISEQTGMVENITTIKKLIKMAVMDVLDHKNLDKDVPYFKDVVSTTENVAIFIWNGLQKLMNDPSMLYEVKIFETEKNIVCYRGDFV